MIATATCPKCGHTNELTPCQNCGSTDFRRGPLTDGSTGMICSHCNLGHPYFACQSGCGALIPATSFGTPVSRIAERALEGQRVHQGGQCFIATELYGSDSAEVATLRRFRDQSLLTNRPGTAFVTSYYCVSPKVIPVMRRSAPTRRLLRALVALFVFAVRRTPIGSDPVA